jgi:two-component system sensor histidine kinase AlgZ
LATQNQTSKIQQTWLPDFCSLSVLMKIAFATQLVLFVIHLAPSSQNIFDTQYLALSTVFAQWLALCCSLCLCRLKPLLSRLSVAFSATLAFVVTLCITWLGAIVAHSLDQLLGMGATSGMGEWWSFANRVAFVGAIVTAAAFRYFYVRTQWQQGVQTQAKAQFEALQARIRPHFLFNSMNTIASLIKIRPADAERAVEDLSDLFRSAMQPAESISTLGAELELAKRYLAIEQLRLGDRLKIDIQTEDVPKELAMPVLLLQPLVENAVYHGIAALPEGGTIKIYRVPSQTGLTLGISNPIAQQSAHHVGNQQALDNIRQRLALFYGDRARLQSTITQDRYEVQLTLPYP